VGFALGSGRPAAADPKVDVQSKIKQAMDSYDSMEYDVARKVLNQAIATAKKAKLDKDPLVAKAYLDLGIVAFNMPDLDAAKLSFMSAVQIDPKIQLEAAYKTADMAKLLDEARVEATGGTAAPAAATAGAGASAAECKAIKGLEHAEIDTAKSGVALPITAKVSSSVKATKVSVMYRGEHATEFTEVKMTKQGDCEYTGTIPASALREAKAFYYVAAYNDAGKPIASKGSSGSPNLLELEGKPPPAEKAAVATDREDPINGGKVTKTVASAAPEPSDDQISKSVSVGPKEQHIVLAVAGGTGFGYVTGMTEGMNTVKNCCIGNSLVVVQPEIGYIVSRRTTVSFAARLGFPVGANVDGHATLAPAGLLRVRYALSSSGEGVHVMGQAGAGIIRNTIKLDNAAAGQDIDIVAQGPLLVGGGLGFTKKLSGNVAFVADASALAGIAVVSQFGSAPALNSGVTADVSLGLALGF
jgi:hypothetical protein